MYTFSKLKIKDSDISLKRFTMGFILQVKVLDDITSVINSDDDDFFGGEVNKLKNI